MNWTEVYEFTHLTVNALKSASFDLGFKEIVPALVSKHFEPGAKHSIAVLGNQKLPRIEVDEEAKADERVAVSGHDHYYLPVSHVVEKQMALEHLDKVVCLAPCLRLLMEGEDVSRKHLYTFFQFEIEWRTESMDDVFATGERLICSAMQSFAKSVASSKTLRLNETARRNLESISAGGFSKIRFSDAAALIGKSLEKNVDFTPDEDTTLTSKFDKPFWIYDYPEGVRDSIYHRNERQFYDTYDLMLPFGYGELTTGGIRAKSGSEIVRQSKMLGREHSANYASWKDQTGIQTAGFGIGLERLLKFIVGADSITELVQYHDHGPNRTIGRKRTSATKEEPRGDQDDASLAG